MTHVLSLDSFGLHVLHNALANITAEMALVMMKTAYSTIFNEGLDFSTVLLDRDGNLIAEKNYTPSMMGAIPNTVRWALEELGEDFFQPGDVVVHNDPYRGNCHMPEHMMMKPIFLDHDLVACAGCIAPAAELPDGESSAAMWVEDDGVTTDPFEVKVAIVIRGDEIIADFTGSSAQVKGPMNAVYVVAASAVYNAVFCVTDPMTLIPRNSGCYRPIRIVAPPGSVVNCEHPAPSVGGNTDLQPKLIDLLLEALAPAAPAMVAASTGGSSPNLSFGGENPTPRQLSSYFPFQRHGARLNRV